MRIPLAPVALLFTLALWTTRAMAQDDHVSHAESHGTVSFPTSCQAAVQPKFDRAVAMLHSFWFDQAQATFAEVAAEDPACAMAHWGVAMTLLGNPFVGQPLPEPRLREALATALRADSMARTATARERGYAAAAVALYAGAEAAARRPRSAEHEAAMRRVYEQFPDDPEAVIFYGRAVIGNAPLSDTTSARQLHAAALMEPIFREQPDHPGLAHYLIHAFDSPRLAQHGLAAARLYADIAPNAPHALHMPSHIFTRLGYWDESIATNRRSAAAEPDSNAAVHPNDYLVYAYLQQGREREAGMVVARAAQISDRFYGGLIGYNFAAMHARYALERGQWSEAARLPVPEAALPFVQAATRFARALGAARGGDSATARAEVDALAALEEKLRADGDAYWALAVGAQRVAASAWVAHLAGNDAEALRLAGEGAALEDAIEKHPVTPGPLIPARELEGDLLLHLKRYAEAGRAYERTLEREPRRARSLYGAARAAELAKNDGAARKHYGELLALMERADAGRADVAAARVFLSP